MLLAYTIQLISLKKYKPSSFYSSTTTRTLRKSNVHRSCSQDTLTQSLAKVSAIIITVWIQSARVLSYRLSQSSEETRGIWHWLSLRTGQSKYTVSTFLPPLIFSLEGQDKMQAHRQDMLVSDRLIHERDSISQLYILAFQFHLGSSIVKQSQREGTFRNSFWRKMNIPKAVQQHIR